MLLGSLRFALDAAEALEFYALETLEFYAPEIQVPGNLPPNVKVARAVRAGKPWEG